MMLHDFFEDLKNALIVKLVKSTHLHASVIYSVLWKLYDSDIEFYSKEVINARKESGCFTQSEYSKWWNENKWPEAKKMLDKYNTLEL